MGRGSEAMARASAFPRSRPARLAGRRRAGRSRASSTLHALHALEQADVILHDALVAPEILTLCGPRARLEAVGKRAGQKEPEAARDQPAPDRARAPEPARRAPQGWRPLGVRARRRGGAGAGRGRRAVPHRAGRHRRPWRARLCRHPGDPSRPRAVGRLRHRAPCRRRRRARRRLGGARQGRRDAGALHGGCSACRRSPRRCSPPAATRTTRSRSSAMRPRRASVCCATTLVRGRGGRGQRRSRQRHADRDRPGGGLERAAVALARRGAGEPADPPSTKQLWQSKVRGARCLAWACRSSPRPLPSRPSTSRC